MSVVDPDRPVRPVLPGDSHVRWTAPSMTTVPEHYQDIVFDMPDGRTIAISVFKDGRFRLMEKSAEEHAVWGPPVEGSVWK